MNTLSEKQTCPFCGTSHIQKWLPLKEYDIYSCSACEGAWTFPPPPDRDYSEEDFHKAAQPQHENIELLSVAQLPSQWKKSVLMQCDLLERHLKKGARVLEIGCGQGILLEELKKRGFDVVGIEPSEPASLRAQQKGLNVSNGYFTSAEQIPQNVDVVILSQVFEHIQNFENVLKMISENCTNTHLLFVQTNYKGLIPRIWKHRWYGWVPDQHYWHFTPKSQTRLSQKFGFEYVACEYSSLVHTAPLPRMLSQLICLYPPWHDQFHLLLKQDHGKTA